MPETRDSQSVIVAAEQAAAAGDYASAEALLREAARLQEAALGPLHPDLANTLNNLGIVCEITDKPTDAEHFFRRAYEIATAALEPDHPFVATSRKNLEDFCAARGIPVDSPSSSSVADAPSASPPSPEAVQPEPSSYEESRPVASKTSSRALAIGGLIAGGLLLALIATTTWFRSNGTTPSSQRTESAPPPDPVTTPAAPPVVPIEPSTPKGTPANKGDAPAAQPKPDAAISQPAPDRERSEPPPTPPAAAAENKPDAASGSPPVVATAQLCRDLATGGPLSPSSVWHCVPPGDPVGSGPLFFYTRVKSPTAITVQHRWYRDDRLRRVVDLPIRANATDGYRTYSRHTVDNAGTGEWRVELRTTDGVLLREERFVVR
jgi:hypothetical protein